VAANLVNDVKVIVIITFSLRLKPRRISGGMDVGLPFAHRLNHSFDKESVRFIARRRRVSLEAL
jgi:hypothetical protein